MGKLDDVVKEAKGAAPVDDDEIEVDFSGAVDFTPVAVGKYQAVLVKHESKPTQAGDPAMRWQYEIIAAADEDGEEYVGRKLTRTLMLVGKGAGITRETLRAHGVECENDQIRVSPGKVIAAAVPVEITVKHRKGTGDYEGRIFEDIEKVAEVA